MKQVFSGRWIIELGIAASIGSSIVLAVPAAAQIVPDNTLPNPSNVEAGCTICTINDGTLRGNNLFHSFTEFSVPQGGEAIFNNLNTVENIFSRVTGNSVSNIDGVIRANGTANVFLLNPNGIILGPNARLNVGGSFTASTANALIFTDGAEFSATNPESPPLLTINPNVGWQHDNNQNFATGATLTNRGSLAAGQDLTLMAEQLDVQGQLYAGRNLRLIATENLRVRDSVDTPTVIAANNQLWVRGNEAIDIFALNHPASVLFSGEEMLLQSENPVLGDTHYWSGGRFRITTLDETLGALASPNDPIIRALGDVTFDAYQGSSLHILAGGSVDIGTIVITQPELGAPTDGFLQETIQLSSGTSIEIDGGAQPTLDIRAGVSTDAIGTTELIGVDPFFDVFFDTPELTASAIRANITVGDVFIAAPDGLVLLTNQYQPNSALAGGDIAITDTGLFGDGIDVRGFDEPGGAVVLDARGTIFLESSIDSSADLADAGDITLVASGDIALAEGSGIFASGFSGGNILLRSDGTIVATNSLISSDSTALTPSTRQGSVTLLAPSVLLSGEATFVTATTAGVRRGSPVVIQANDVTFDGSSILTGVEEGATGQSSNVEIVANRLSLLRGGNILSFNLGEGGAGDIAIIATDSVILDGVSQDGRVLSSLTSNVFLEATGDVGNISITTPKLTITDGGFLTSTSFGMGDAGDIVINASEVLFDGVSTQAGVVNRSGILTTAREGNGGEIRITGQTLDITNGAIFLAGSDGLGSGVPGNVIFDITDTIAIDGNTPFGPSSIVVSTLEGAEEDGGDINITTRDFFLSNGAVLRADTFTEGKGGNIFVTSQTFSLSNDAQVAAISNGEGDAGNVTVNADVLSLDQESLILTETTNSQGGTIRLTLQDLFLLRNGSLISATAGLAQGTGDGGNIIIDAASGSVVAVPQEDSNIRANAFEGQGGRIEITAQGVFGIEDRGAETDLSDLVASSEASGRDGTTQVETLGLPPDPELITLPSDFLNASQLVAQDCEQFSADSESQGAFYVSGRGGIVPLASEVFSSDDVVEDLRLPEPWTEDSPIAEAQDWFMNDTGEVVLTAIPVANASHTQCWR